MKPRRDEREFAGVRPRNQSIVDRVRKEGHVGVMFNKDDFMDAVVWAANIVYDYKDFFASHRERIVIPKNDLPFWKPDLINAHILMIVYYQMKQNYVLVEELKQSLKTVAKFQDIDPDDIELMRKWDDYMSIIREQMEKDDFGDYDIGDLQGTEKKYEHYSQIVAKEVEELKEKVAQL